MERLLHWQSVAFTRGVVQRTPQLLLPVPGLGTIDHFKLLLITVSIGLAVTVTVTVCVPVARAHRDDHDGRATWAQVTGWASLRCVLAR